MDNNRPSLQQIVEMQARVSGWVSPENIAKAKGQPLQATFNVFGKSLESIAYVPDYYTKRLSIQLKDNLVYSSKAYFIDHAANHHSEVPIEDYQRIQEIIDSPDDVKVSIEKKALVFFKRYTNIGTLWVGIGKNADSRGLYHISFFNISEKNKSQYDDLPSIPAFKTSLVDDHPTVRPDNSRHWSSCS
jgi:hypothetical protein